MDDMGYFYVWVYLMLMIWIFSPNLLNWLTWLRRMPVFVLFFYRLAWFIVATTWLVALLSPDPFFNWFCCWSLIGLPLLFVTLTFGEVTF